MPTRTSHDLLADLRRVRLLPADRLAAAEADGAADWPPERFAEWLQQAGFSPFQVRRLFAGRADSLRFGPYLLLDKLGEGGMGVVYRAWNGRARRVDAVKVIRPDRLASKTVGRRFLREIRLTAELRHPNLVRAVGAGEAGGRWYLATECVPGRDLAAVVRTNGPLPPPGACRAVAEAAAALGYIAGRGLVHRDVKPSNLVREKGTGTVKLLDFGLSGGLRGAGPESVAATLTAAGVMLGTPDYMAPEQATNPHGVDVRADLYALGGTLYFLLTGKPPYTGNTVDKLVAHATAPPPPLVLPDGSSPAELAAILCRLMAKKPADRFQTPEELIEALGRLRFDGKAAPELVAVPVDGSAETVANGTGPSDGSSDFDGLTAPANRPGDRATPRWVWWAAAGAAVAAAAGIAAAAIWG
jgi:serine/threonine protein kinase